MILLAKLPIKAPPLLLLLEKASLDARFHCSTFASFHSLVDSAAATTCSQVATTLQHDAIERLYKAAELQLLQVGHYCCYDYDYYFSLTTAGIIKSRLATIERANWRREQANWPTTTATDWPLLIKPARLNLCAQSLLSDR